MTPDEVSRELAALVAVVSIAMVAIAISLLRQYWNIFERHRLVLSRAVWKTTFRLALMVLLCFMLTVVVYALFRIVRTDFIPPLLIFLLIGAFALPMAILIIDLVIRWKIKKQIIVPVDRNTYLYFVALAYMASSVLFNIIALAGVAPAMLLITFGPFSPRSFEWAKWHLVIGIAVFSIGIALFGIAFVLDKAEQWKNKLPKDNQK